MSATDYRADPRRAENLALLGLVLQTAATIILTLLVYWKIPAESLAYLRMQLAIGVAFWLISWWHLWLKRRATEEKFDIEETERQRRVKGMASLYEASDEPPAQRNLRHFEQYVAPAASMLLGLWLLINGALFLILRLPLGVVPEELALNKEAAKFGAATAGIMAFLLFIPAKYATGLSRIRQWRQLRAGAGYMVSSVLGLLVACVTLALYSQAWVGEWINFVAVLLIASWMGLQGLEILANFLMDFYRPRIAGVETRPAYDSRLSGLFAEPEGLFRTFAHTLDYQFGFKISQTWFFRFVERAFMPLLTVQLLSLYLMSCLTVVEPGQQAVIEVWGAPQGWRDLPTDESSWDRLPPPRGPGLHLTWPWPVARARIVDTNRVKNLTLGFDIEMAPRRDGSIDYDAYERKATEYFDNLRDKVLTWEKKHLKSESYYLMPLPPSMSQERNEAEDIERRSKLVDALFLTATFTIEYRIGKEPGDIYRYLYRHYEGDARPQLQHLAESEIAAYLAGADFWRVMSGDWDATREELLEGIRARVREHSLGLQVTNLSIFNIHPPAGEVGQAFQEVVASEHQKAIEIYRAKSFETEILGLAPAERNRILAEAESYRHRLATITAAEAEQFRNQLEAYAAAPEAYLVRKQMRVLEKALAQPRKVLLPKYVTPVIDDTKAFELNRIQRAIRAEIE